MPSRAKITTAESFRGLVGTQGRIQIPKPIRDKLNISEGDYYNAQIYGQNKDKILITIIK